MNPLVERRLNETAGRLRVARAIKLSAVMLCAATAALLLVGAMIQLGHVTTRGAAWELVTLIVVTTGVAWLLALLLNAIAPVAREQLARETEQATPGLMDRLHTLLFLAPRRHVQRVESYAGRIEQQSAVVLYDARASVVPVVRHDSRRWLMAWIMLTLLTTFFYQWFRPFSQLGQASAAPPAAEEPAGLDLPPAPEPNQALDEESEPWIEVRIWEPGQDIVATRFESIALRIDAATSGVLDELELEITHNGETQRSLELPTAADPHFARREAVLDLAQLEARDWDVVSYHATVTSTDGMRAESRMDFVDVRPPQEEIEQLPGGVEGEPYRLLNDLTGMVGAQADAIRAAHRQSHSIPDQTDPQALSELARAQDALKLGAEYLESSLPEDAGLSSAAEQLRLAAESCQQSAEHFRDGQAAAGQQAAQQAIAQLAAARREIHDAVKDDPEVLPGPRIDTDPTADLATQLEESEQFREQLRTAAEEAARMADEQRELAERIRPCENDIHRQAAVEQQERREEFDQFRQQHAQACESAGGASAEAESALDTAIAALDELAQEHTGPSHRSANRATAGAAAALQELASSLEQQAANEQTAAARQLQQALDRQIDFLDHLQQDPDAFTDEQLEQAARNMQATTSEIKQMAEDPQAGQQFSDELREELNDENKQRLDGLCQGVCQSPGGAGRQQAAGLAKAGLQRVRQAMQASPSGLARRPGAGEPLATDAAQALARARRQLESLLRGANDAPSNTAAQQTLLREALRNLRAGVAPAGRGAPPDDLISSLEQQLDDRPSTLDLESLRRLLSQLEPVRVERIIEPQTDQMPSVSHLAPQNYPPGYRDWIQRYFRRVAEQH